MKSEKEMGIIARMLKNSRARESRVVNSNIGMHQAALDSLAIMLVLASVAGNSMDSLVCTGIPLTVAAATYLYSLSLNKYKQ